MLEDAGIEPRTDTTILGRYYPVLTVLNSQTTVTMTKSLIAKYYYINRIFLLKIMDAKCFKIVYLPLHKSKRIKRLQVTGFIKLCQRCDDINTNDDITPFDGTNLFESAVSDF